MRLGIVLAAALPLWAPTAPMAVTPDCEPARCAVQGRIDQECPCAGAQNHGRYVSCVAHIVRDLARDGTIPTNCKGKVKRCAARSTCGKDGFITCLIPTDTCDLTTHTCVGDPTVSCTTDLGCGSRCKISASEPLCTARNGTRRPGTSCCPGCP